MASNLEHAALCPAFSEIRFKVYRLELGRFGHLHPEYQRHTVTRRAPGSGFSGHTSELAAFDSDGVAAAASLVGFLSTHTAAEPPPSCASCRGR